MLSGNWLERADIGSTLRILEGFALRHARLGGQQGAEIASAIASRDFHSLCEWELQYRSHDSPLELYHCRQALAFYSKAEFLPIQVDRRRVAAVKFLESENRCFKTNRSFIARHEGVLFPPHVERVLTAASRKIARVLGPVPGLQDLNLRFGPGATTTTRRRDASVRQKIEAGLQCSTNLVDRLAALLSELPHLRTPDLVSLDPETDEVCLQYSVEINNGRLGFVAKTALTDRTIIVEPVLNSILQLGYGEYIGSCLRAVGVDLTSQSRNQRLAKLGSLTGELATLDLSGASDSICTELVADLLPVDWFLALSEARTSTIDFELKDDPGCKCSMHLEKFSSMGNGFTFPLESLIFWALTTACSEGFNGEVSVYGDDIICPVGAVPLVLEVFGACGFVINKKKSFWEGPFRESCGCDYLLGIDIRPYYQKSLVDSASLFSLHNYYVRRGLHGFAREVVEYIHPSLRIYGPDGYGDGHLIGDWIPRPHGRSRGWAGYLFDTFTRRGRLDKPLRPGDYVTPLYSIYQSVSETESVFWVDPSENGIPRSTASCIIAPTVSPYRRSKASSQAHTAGEVLRLPLPGTRGYKRISIYTLTCQ